MIDDLLDAIILYVYIYILYKLHSAAAHKKKIIWLLLISADEWPAAARSQSRERVLPILAHIYMWETRALLYIQMRVYAKKSCLGIVCTKRAQTNNTLYHDVYTRIYKTENIFCGTLQENAALFLPCGLKSIIKCFSIAVTALWQQNNEISRK